MFITSIWCLSMFLDVPKKPRNQKRQCMNKKVKFNSLKNLKLDPSPKPKVKKNINSLFNLYKSKNNKERKNKRKIGSEAKERSKDWKVKLNFSKSLNILLPNLKKKKLFLGRLQKLVFPLVWRKYKLIRKKEKKRYWVWQMKNINIPGNSFPKLLICSESHLKNNKNLKSMNIISNLMKFPTIKANNKGWNYNYNLKKHISSPHNSNNFIFIHKLDTLISTNKK